MEITFKSSIWTGGQVKTSRSTGQDRKTDKQTDIPNQITK